MKASALALMLALTAARSFAADATFSKDGQRVYLIQFDTSKLTVIDIEKQSTSEMDLGRFTDKQLIVTLTLSRSGDLLFVTPHDAWSYSFAKKSCTKLCTIQKRTEFKDLACDPEDGSMLFSTQNADLSEGLLLKTDKRKLRSVRVRRLGYLEGMAFSQDGELFFGSGGDLWKGTIIDVDEPDKDDATDFPPSLEGIRCAALATLETADGTPSQIGVHRVAIANEILYVHLYRMGGSGWGNIVRLRKPEGTGVRRDDPSLPEDQVIENDLLERLKLYAKELSSVEILAKNGKNSYLCASPDGKRVFFTTDTVTTSPDVEPKWEKKIYVIENNGKPRELNIKLPNEEAR